MEQGQTTAQFSICIRRDGSEDLEVGKVYRVVEDEAAARSDYIRVIDQSGEDYPYPAAYFVPVSLPEEAKLALMAGSSEAAT